MQRILRQCIASFLRNKMKRMRKRRAAGVAQRQLVEKVRSRPRPFARTASSLAAKPTGTCLTGFRKRWNPNGFGNSFSETVTLNHAAARCPSCRKSPAKRVFRQVYAAQPELRSVFDLYGAPSARYRPLPIKNRAMVPGPECTPMVGHMGLISTSLTPISSCIIL